MFKSFNPNFKDWNVEQLNTTIIDNTISKKKHKFIDENRFEIFRSDTIKGRESIIA